MRRNVKLRDMNLVVEAADERSIEVLASETIAARGTAGSGHHPPEGTLFRWNYMHQRSDHQQRRVASRASGTKKRNIGNSWKVAGVVVLETREVGRRSDRLR